MKNQASFAWKANSEGLNKKNNTFQLNHNSCIADGKEYCFRTILSHKGIITQRVSLLLSAEAQVYVFLAALHGSD